MIKLFFKSAATLGTLALLGYFTWIYVIPSLERYESRDKETYFVRRVIDGDTFELWSKDEKGKYEKVRLLGVDTPEKYESFKLDRDAKRTKRDKKTIKKLGELASDYSRKLLQGKKIKLVSELGYQERDKYGRLLRYVYLDDGTFVNKKIIEDGYAYAYREYKISVLDEFISMENDARVNKRGLWGEVEGLKDLSEPPKNKR